MTNNKLLTLFIVNNYKDFLNEGQTIWYYMNMTAQEKESLYNLLKTVSSAIDGYTSVNFKNENPSFSDDVSAQVESARPASSSQTASDAQPAISQQSVSPQQTVSNQTSAPSQTSSASFDISSKINSCTRCPLSKTTSVKAPGYGVSNPFVYVLLDSPNDEPMINELLTKMLSAISLSPKSNCYISTVVKCTTPNNREPNGEELAACLSFVDAEISMLKPKIIIAMGKVAAQTLLRTNLKITELRGEFTEYNKIPLMPTYHPKTLIVGPQFKVDAWADLKLVKSKLLELVPFYENTFKN